MALNYNKLNVSVNNKYIMADSLSINSESPQKPLYGLNYKFPFDNTPTTLRHNINMSYLIEPLNDPAYLLISGWKANNNTGSLQCTMAIGEITFIAFLNSYSFDVLPNQVIKANASYSAFNQNTFIMENQPDPNDAVLYNLQNSTGIAHYWSTQFTAGTGFTPVDNSILQFNYSFNANTVPSYRLGYYTAIQVSVLDAVEEINVVNESQQNLDFTGLGYNYIFGGGIDNIRLRGLSSTWGDVERKIDFSLSGFELMSNENSISNNNLVLFTHNLKKYY